MVTPAASKRVYEDAIAARWEGGPTVLAFLFAHPDSDAFLALDGRGDYFNTRTGDTWDLFFPGYFISDNGAYFEEQAGSRKVGKGHASDWYFSPGSFDTLRRHVERESGGRWEYSGGSDLVLINGWMLEHGDPVVDWASTAAGSVTDESTGTRTLSLPEVIERLSRDLEQALEDPRYGVSAVTDGSALARAESDVKKVMLSAMGGIIGALGKQAIGL